MDTRDNDDLDFTWTTGNNPVISHRRLIDSGAFGEVHEVSSHSKWQTNSWTATWWWHWSGMWMLPQKVINCNANPSSAGFRKKTSSTIRWDKTRRCTQWKTRRHQIMQTWLSQQHCLRIKTWKAPKFVILFSRYGVMWFKFGNLYSTQMDDGNHRNDAAFHKCWCIGANP